MSHWQDDTGDPICDRCLRADCVCGTDEFEAILAASLKRGPGEGVAV